MPTITVELDQVSPSTTEARIRDHRVLIDRPEAKGGEDRGAMGGELMLAALGGCFASNLLAAIRARDAQVEGVTLRVEGDLVDAPKRFAAVRLTARAERADPALFEKLVTMSERACIVANTLKGGTELSVRAEVASPTA